jgi:hypothetical protein
LTRSAVVRLTLVLPSPEPWQGGMEYIGIAGTNEMLVGPEIRVRESPLVLWAVAAGLLALLAVAYLFWHFFMIRWLIERSDRKYKRHPKLTYTAQREPERCAKEWPLRGVRILCEPRVVELADGQPWAIDKFQIKRLRRPGPKVAVQLTYRPLGAKKGVVKKTLEATGDAISIASRHPIVGLPDDQTADFVLFTGRVDN